MESGHLLMLAVLGLVIGVTAASQEAFAEYVGRPDQTISNTDWTVIGAGTAHQATDELTPNDDTDYITGTATTANIEFGLPNFSDPETSEDHVLSFTAQAVNGGDTNERVQIFLYEGAVEIANKKKTINRGSYDTETYTLDAAEADSITDYNDLRIVLKIIKIQGGEEIRITQAQLKIPGAETIIIPVVKKKGGSVPYEPPTIGRSLDSSKQMVENGICIDIDCWTVTQGYHQEFELYEMLTGNHTISFQIFFVL